MANIGILKKDEYNEWDKFVEENKGSIYQTTIIPRIITSRNSNVRFKIVSFKENNKIIGGFLLYEYKKWFLNVGTTKFPGIPYSGFVFDKNVSSKKRFKIIEDIANDNQLFRNYFYTAISNPPGFAEVRPFMFSKKWVVKNRFTHQVDLDMFDIAKMDTKFRKKYKKAAKEGIETRKEERIDKQIINIHQLNENENNFNTSNYYGLELFNDLPIRIFSATGSDGLIKAFDLFLIERWNSKAYRWFSGCLPDYKRKRVPTKLLVDSMIQLKQENIKTVDLMGGNMKNLIKFTIQLNPKVVHYFEVSKKMW